MRSRRLRLAKGRQFMARDYMRLARKARVTSAYAFANPSDERADDRARQAYVDFALASEFYPKEVTNV